jgi:hypothetical protein
MPLFLALLLMPSLSSAAVVTGEWVLKSSELVYTVSHPLKTAHGRSDGAKGRGRCTRDSCEFLVAVPVKSFLSGDTNRDLHMLETMKGAEHPMASVRISGPSRIEGASVALDAHVEVAGRQHDYKGLSFEVLENTAKVLKVRGTLKLLLKDFEVTPPSLLMQEIKNEVPVDVSLEFGRP